MAQQFDIFRTATGEHVLVLQHDLLGDLATRTVCLAVPAHDRTAALPALEPVVSTGDLRLRIVPHVVATFTLAELGTLVANVAHDRDRIIRAFDILLTGA